MNIPTLFFVNLLKSYLEKNIDKEQPQQQGIKHKIYYQNQYSKAYKTDEK